MQIDVLITPQIGTTMNLAEYRVVVLDILRATSTIVTALGNGAMEVIPEVEPAEVRKRVRDIGVQDCVSGGERKGYKIEGFDLGNSPAEYTKERVNGKKVILCTTNGTKAIKWAQGASEILIGSFLNIQCLIDYLKKSQQSLIIVCSGREMNLSLEDLACAGMIVQKLEAEDPDLQLTDSARVARLSWERFASQDLGQFIRQTEHGRYLMEIGMEHDVVGCVTLNQFPILPRFVKGKITL